MNKPRIPIAAQSIQKGVPLKNLLAEQAAQCLAHNIALVHAEFDSESFVQHAIEGIEPLGIIARGRHFATALQQFLPQPYEAAIQTLLASLTPPVTDTKDNGLAVFFYLPHVSFVGQYGLDVDNNHGRDPFDISMKAQYELTQRFSAEFSIRTFLIEQQERTLAQLMQWLSDPNPHVRRLCSEGTRPRLPWAQKIPAFIADPSPVFPILEALKDDLSLYVRRSVANHLGDVAKDHPDVVFALCQKWLVNSNNETRWLIRHALRYPAQKRNATALTIINAAQTQK